MKKLVLATVLVLLALPAEAAVVQLKILQPYQAGQNEGGLAAVKGRADIHPDGILPGTDIDLIDDTGRRSFIGFIPKLNEYLFPDLATLNGKTVVMYGVIEFYESLPTTQLLNRAQVRLAQ
jgi:hypothetical protein